MPAERDPRVDPRPGDAMRKGKIARFVTERDGNHIIYARKVGEVPRASGSFTCWITTWQDWAKDATVLHVAEVQA